MRKTLLVSLTSLLVLVAACGDDDDATSSSDTVASSDGDVLRLTFDGTDCVYDGPEQVAAGVVEIDLVNESDGFANVFVGLLEEGATAEEFAGEFDTEPMNSWGPFSKYIAADMGGKPPADAGETARWEGNLAAGEYVMTCRERAGSWWGSALTVVDA